VSRTEALVKPQPREARPVLECVLNISEGRDHAVIADIARAAGGDLLDVHSDPHHHRSVLTLLGEDAPRAVAEAAVLRIDLRHHEGVHPRLGVVDVVPFVALDGGDPALAVQARDRFATWFAGTHGVPCFRYGEERSLPTVRRTAFRDLRPTDGPGVAHPTAGATAVGARPVLVAYNVWIEASGLAVAQQLAAAARQPYLRALGLAVGDRLQVSMNLIEPLVLGPAAAYDEVVRLSEAVDARVVGAELVGLVPDAVLRQVPTGRWEQLDLSEDRTIEARIERTGGVAPPNAS
jgi:glutamate formiminotransferase